MGSYFDDTGYAATLSQGDRLTREEFRDQMSRRIVAGITIWDRDQGRPAQVHGQGRGARRPRADRPTGPDLRARLKPVLRDPLGTR